MNTSSPKAIAASKQLLKTMADQPINEQEILYEELRAEVESSDVGQVAQSDDERLLHQYLRRRAQILEEVERIQTCTSMMIAELNRKLAGLEYIYENRCAEIVRGMLKGKSKSVKTPYGVAGFRHQPKRLVIEDQNKVLAAWTAFELPQQVVRKVEREPEYKIDKAALDKHYETSDEIPAGCSVKLAHDTFYVK